MADQPIALSIILPAYNEGPKVKASVGKIEERMRLWDISYELIVVDDGSCDDTLKMVRECASDRIRVFSYERNQGKGYAVQYGMLRAKGEYRIFMDVDLSTSLEEMEKFFNEIRKKEFDVVIGTRKADPSLQKIRQPFYRRFLGGVFTKLSGFFVGCAISDFTCGFKMYTKSAAEIIFKRQRISGWSFDTELIYIAALHGLKIRELPVVWSHDSDTKVRVIQDIISSLLGLFKIRLNAARGLYR